MIFKKSIFMMQILCFFFLKGMGDDVQQKIEWLHALEGKIKGYRRELEKLSENYVRRALLDELHIYCLKIQGKRLAISHPDYDTFHNELHQDNFFEDCVRALRSDGVHASIRKIEVYAYFKRLKAEELSISYTLLTEKYERIMASAGRLMRMKYEERH